MEDHLTCCVLPKLNKKATQFAWPFFEIENRLHHPAHTASGRHGRGFFLFSDFADHGLRSQQQACDGSGVLQGETSHLRRVDDTGSEKLFKLVFAGIITEVFLAVTYFVYDD